MRAQAAQNCAGKETDIWFAAAFFIYKVIGMGVSSIIPKMYVEGDYMQHVVNVCRKALEDNPGGYILLVDTSPTEISEVKKALSKRMGDVTVMTAATEQVKGVKTDFTP